jgi:hypothetical protein
MKMKGRNGLDLVYHMNKIIWIQRLSSVHVGYPVFPI